MTASARRFVVHAAHQGRSREHAVDGCSVEDAAVAFVETWHPPADEDDGEVTLIVTECETGVEHCLRVDVSSGAAEPCDPLRP